MGERRCSYDVKRGGKDEDEVLRRRLRSYLFKFLSKSRDLVEIIRVGFRRTEYNYSIND